MSEQPNRVRMTLRAMTVAMIAVLALPVKGEPLFDPTRPPGTGPAAQEPTQQNAQAEPVMPRLQAVFSQAGSYSALLDGRRVRPGDYLGEYRVASIGRDGVILQREGEGEPLQLNIRGSGIKRETQEKILGAIHKDEQLDIDERHLGLIPSNEENHADRKIDYIADRIRQQVNLDQLIAIANTAEIPLPDTTKAHQADFPATSPVRIGIFRDEAFGFYYPDDLEAMQAYGAQLLEINSLHDKELPDIDGLFIGGGFPETMMQALYANTSLRSSVKNAIESGMPAYAECGGLMYLSRSIFWKDQQYDMAGVIQGDVVMENTPQGRGYIQLQETGHHPWDSMRNADRVFAHEFHYSKLVNIDFPYDYAYKVIRGTGIDGKHDGLVYKNLLANYGHLRNTSSNRWVKRFIDYINSKKHTRHAVALSSTIQ